MKRISLAVVVALGISFCSVASAKLVPDYRNSDFQMSTQDSRLLNLRHKLVTGLCSMYQKVNIGPVAAYLNSNINFDTANEAFMDKALTTFNKYMKDVPGMKKPKDSEDKGDDEAKKPYPTTDKARYDLYIKERNEDIIETYRDDLLDLAESAKDLNMPIAQKRLLLSSLQEKTLEYLNRRYGQDFQYNYGQKMAQDLQIYMDLKNEFPCLYKKDPKKAVKKADKNGAKAKKVESEKKENKAEK